jgi:hypothetical protein
MASTPTSSSSATICRKPVQLPCPNSIFGGNIVTVLSALIASHESTCATSGGTFGVFAARAPPAVAAPSMLKPTISAPPLFRNDRRENSLFRISVMATSHPSPSRPRPPGRRP